jgi:hypothetical protein
MLFAATNADVIFAKKHQTGFIYLLKFKENNEKRHSTVNNSIDELDAILINHSASKHTAFVTIDEEHRGSGKVRSFTGKDRLNDEYFRMIFDIFAPKINGDYKLQEGVMRLSNHTNGENEEEETFDVVKKRKAMDSAPQDADDNNDTSPTALAAFEDFERSVLPALKGISRDEENHRRQELVELEDRMAKGLQISTTGGVYFAWSDCLGCMKIGATRREDPSLRLRELSRYVTSPFTLVRWLPTPTPFRLESQAHAHFAAKRIRTEGAGTEFFRITAEEAGEWTTTMREED